ncbi:MAG: hypothetical protein JJV89_05230 [Desulfosarcina sp.]|nr:hypothetical protein [Desulfobacterales bacterium]
MSKKKNIFIIFIGLFFISCGYRFTGGGDLPEGIKTVYVKTLENRTSETGIENIITDDIIYEFTRSRQADITEKERADAVLSGYVSSLTIGTVSRQDSHTSRERRITIAVDLTLTGNDGRRIWTRKGISSDEAYDVSSNKSSTEQNKREAVKILSKRLAEKAYSRLTDNF